MQQLDYTYLLLRDCRPTLLKQNDHPLDIVLLEAVAKARYGLTASAEWLYRLHIEKNVDRELSHGARKLCDVASNLCDQTVLKWPR